MRPFGELVNEHSFILDHSPQDGKKFRVTLIWLAKCPSEIGQDAFRSWIVAGQKGMWVERISVPSCGILVKKLRVENWELRVATRPSRETERRCRVAEGH
jgi:hypothetical protein